MFSIFGKKKEVISPLKIIQDMRDTLSTLEKREEFLSKRINSCKEDAKKALKEKNKQKALFHLKKSKMNEKQINSLYGQRETIETQILALEQNITNTNIITAMKNGQSTISSLTDQCKPEDVEDLMDKISDELQKTDEISTAMAIPVGQVYDDDDLLAELEDDDEKILEKFEKMIIPTKPINTTTNDTIENELKQLEEMMNI